MAKTGCALLAAVVRKMGSQAKVAKEARVSEALVSRILNEGVQPSLDTAFLLQDRLGIPVVSWRRERSKRASGGPTRPRSPSPAEGSGERQVA